MRSSRSFLLVGCALLLGSCKDLVRPIPPAELPSEEGVSWISVLREVGGVSVRYAGGAELVVFDDAHPLEDGGMVSVPMNQMAATRIDGIEQASYGVALIHTRSQSSLQQLPNLIFEDVQLPGERDLRAVLPELTGSVAFPAGISVDGALDARITLVLDSVDPRTQFPIALGFTALVGADASFTLGLPDEIYRVSYWQRTLDLELNYESPDYRAVFGQTPFQFFVDLKPTQVSFTLPPQLPAGMDVTLSIVKLTSRWRANSVWLESFQLLEATHDAWTVEGMHRLMLHSGSGLFFPTTVWAEFPASQPVNFELPEHRVLLRLLDRTPDELAGGNAIQCHNNERYLFSAADDAGEAVFFLDPGSYRFDVQGRGLAVVFVDGDELIEWPQGGFGQ